MAKEQSMNGPYNGLRVLEVCDESGQWCGKMLADLGADVIKIEPPGGALARSVGPFYSDVYDRNRSLYFWHYNTSKRGVTLNIETQDGRGIFKRLAASADVILETYSPGYLPSIELGYDDLKISNRDLIMCSITPFGQTGPWKDHLTSDLLHLSVGGQMGSCGYDDIPDAPPIAPGGGQAWHMGGHYALMAITAALIYRANTGEGQYIDLSIHEACALTTEGAMSSWIYTSQTMIRQTGRHASVAQSLPTQTMCKDGKYLNVIPPITMRLPPERLRALAVWMDENGMADDLLNEKYMDPIVIQQEGEHISSTVMAFINNMNRDEVYERGQQLGFSWGAVKAHDELPSDGQLIDRGFWVEVEHPEMNQSFKYPGSAAIWSSSPWFISRRAPLIGEHNQEIYCGELGIDKRYLTVLSESGAV